MEIGRWYIRNFGTLLTDLSTAFDYLPHDLLVAKWNDYGFGLPPLRLTAQKMKDSIKGFFNKCDQICRRLRIWSHLLKKPLMENFIFCVVTGTKLLSKRKQRT